MEKQRFKMDFGLRLRLEFVLRLHSLDLNNNPPLPYPTFCPSPTRAHLFLPTHITNVGIGIPPAIFQCSNESLACVKPPSPFTPHLHIITHLIIPFPHCSHIHQIRIRTHDIGTASARHQLFNSTTIIHHPIGQAILGHPFLTPYWRAASRTGTSLRALCNAL